MPWPKGQKQSSEHITKRAVSLSVSMIGNRNGLLGGRPVGIKWTEEQKVAKSKQLLGNKHLLGYVQLEKQKQAVSKALIGKPKSDEHRYRIAEGLCKFIEDDGWHKNSRRTKPELAMRELLILIGEEFEEQKRPVSTFEGWPLGPVDFWLQRRNLVIEVDGIWWHSRPGHVIKDKRKDLGYKEAGIKLIRITDKDLEENMQLVISIIQKEINCASELERGGDRSGTWSI